MRAETPDGIEGEPFDPDIDDADETKADALPLDEEEGVPGDEAGEGPGPWISPPLLKLLVGGGAAAVAAVVALAAIASVRSRARKEADREAAFRSRGIEETYALARTAAAFFSSGANGPPPEFGERFRRTEVVEAVIQRRKPDASGKYVPVAFALGREFRPVSERMPRRPRPLPGSHVFMTRGEVEIEGVTYPVRIFRQVIKDTQDSVVGRVALLLFEP
jgi:hypothetical protein